MYCCVGHFDKCEDGQDMAAYGSINEMEDELLELDEGTITEDLFVLAMPNS